MRAPVTRLLAVTVPLLAAGVLVAGQAQASLSTGYKAVASEDASGVHGQHTGFGPGWIALTFDTSGSPHGPVTGYLFHDGVAGAQGNDHFQVSRISTANAASVTTPFASGYAYGNFNGCTWSYLDDGGDELYDAGSGGGSGCTPTSYTTAQIFCSNHAADVLCSDGSGSGEGEPGVWRNPGNHHATVKAGGCDVWGNLGASAIYSGATGTPRNLLAHVNSGTVDVRYVTKAGTYVMANLLGDGSPQLPNYLQWGFYPRGCLTPSS